MLRLSRFRARRGVLSRFDARSCWSANAAGGADDLRCGWSDDLGEAAAPRRGICGRTSEDPWRAPSVRREDWGGYSPWSRIPQRGYAYGPPSGGDDSEGDVGMGRGRDERDMILDLIEKDMKIQDDVALYLYSKTRELDPKTLLGAMYLKAGFDTPRYSVSAGFKDKFVATVVVRGRRFAGPPCENQEEAEKSAADSALSWVLGQPRQGGPAEGGGGGRGRGRGAGMRGGMRGGGRGRGRGRARGNVKKRGAPPRAVIKPRKCFHVEVNYKLKSFVVLYDHPQQVYYPYKDFPTQRDLDALAKRSSPG